MPPWLALNPVVPRSDARPMIPIQVSPGATWAILAFPVQQAGGAAGTPIAGSFYADGRGGAPNLGDRMSGWEDCRPTPCRAGCWQLESAWPHRPWIAPLCARVAITGTGPGSGPVRSARCPPCQTVAAMHPGMPIANPAFWRRSVCRPSGGSSASAWPSIRHCARRAGRRCRCGVPRGRTPRMCDPRS